MAWLETKGHLFRIRFRFSGAKCLHALRTSAEREARDALARFEEHQRWIDRGIIAPPLGGTNIGVYIMSGGKLNERPSQVRAPERPTLSGLLDGSNKPCGVGLPPCLMAFMLLRPPSARC